MAALTKPQMDSFWRDGFLVVEDAVSATQLARLQSDFAAWVEASCGHNKNYGETINGKPRFDLATEREHELRPGRL